MIPCVGKQTEKIQHTGKFWQLFFLFLNRPQKKGVAARNNNFFHVKTKAQDPIASALRKKKTQKCVKTDLHTHY